MASELWVEKYRPKTVDGYVFRDEQQRAQVMQWVNEKTIPSLLLTGAPGIGKTTLAKVLFNEININPLDILEINASRTNSVEDVRDKITNFVQMIPFGDFKVVLLDECLTEDTLVSIKRAGSEVLLPIKDLNHSTDLVKSFNVELNRVEWKPFELFDKGIQDTLEIEFENGEVVVCTPDHKWYVEDEEKNILVVKASELYKYEHILTP